MTLLSCVTVAVALEFFLCKTKLVDFPVLERLTQYNFKGLFGKLKPEAGRSCPAAEGRSDLGLACTE
jgi:hypothetical protein